MCFFVFFFFHVYNQRLHIKVSLKSALHGLQNKTLNNKTILSWFVWSNRAVSSTISTELGQKMSVLILNLQNKLVLENTLVPIS